MKLGDRLYWYRFQRQGLKASASSMLTTMQVLVEDAMYVSQVKTSMSTEGMLVISGSVPGA